MIFIHIILAVVSLVLASYNLTQPDKTRLKASYIAATGTLTSGALLIFINNASVLRTCLSGMVFFAVVSILNEVSRHKLKSASLV